MSSTNLIPVVGKLTLAIQMPMAAVYDESLETPHFYTFEYTHSYSIPGSPANVWVTFDVQSMMFTDDTPLSPDSSVDELTISVSGSPIATYNRQQLAGLTVKIASPTFDFDLARVGGGSPFSTDEYFGFRIVDIRTTAPPLDFYQFGNRNGADAPIIIQGDDNDSKTGYWAATRPSYESPGVPTIMPQVLPDGCVSKAYSYQFVFPNAVGSVAWSVIDGNLSAGLTLDPVTGILSGTPTVENEIYFTLQAVDSDTSPKTTTGSFYLRIFTNPIVIADDAGSPTFKDPVPTNNRYLFRFRNKIYAMYTDRTSAASPTPRFPVVKSSVDEGKTWQLVNVGDSNTYPVPGHADAVYDGNGHIIWAFWNPSGTTLDSFPLYVATVKSFDLLANSYTTLFTQTIGLTSVDGRIKINPATGDIAIIQTGVTASDNLAGSQIQVHLVSSNGSVDTILSTNLPALAIQGNGLEVLIQDTLVDATGAYHVFWQVKDQISPTESYFYYVRVSSNGTTLGTLRLLDRHWLWSLNSGLAFHGGYVRDSEDELIVPFNYVPPQKGKSGPARVRGTPLSDPVFDYELIECSANNDHSNLSMMAVGEIVGQIGADGSDVFFCVGDASWFPPTSGTVIWLLVNPRDGTGWRYRELFYDPYGVPPFGQNTIDRNEGFIFKIGPLLDPRNLGYSIGFLANGPFEGNSFNEVLFYLRYPHGTTGGTTPPPPGTSVKNYIYSQ